MDCAENESDALTVYDWNWTMFAHISKRDGLSINEEWPSG